MALPPVPLPGPVEPQSKSPLPSPFQPLSTAAAPKRFLRLGLLQPQPQPRPQPPSPLPVEGPGEADDSKSEDTVFPHGNCFCPLWVLVPPRLVSLKGLKCFASVGAAVSACWSSWALQFGQIAASFGHTDCRSDTGCKQCCEISNAPHTSQNQASRLAPLPVHGLLASSHALSLCLTLCLTLCLALCLAGTAFWKRSRSFRVTNVPEVRPSAQHAGHTSLCTLCALTAA